MEGNTALTGHWMDRESVLVRGVGFGRLCFAVQQPQQLRNARNAYSILLFSSYPSLHIDCGQPHKALILSRFHPLFIKFIFFLERPVAPWLGTDLQQ